MRSPRPSGMFGFSVVWLGQVVSLLGTGMTQFALTIWAWQITGQATALALVGFFGYFPRIVLTPLAGALADRWNRKARRRSGISSPIACSGSATSPRVGVSPACSSSTSR